ncbi:hypothetical protein V493_07538 [Pseudogymnoascus sp. VKM F-4281 (FW-2241)]|nr:hypothetical protein V493_07538 [Pseudogymnoascus sp. VKM F-4281 (FW-2241)]
MFDERTGQVFEERIVRIQNPDNGRNWHKKVPIALCQKYRSSETVAYKKYCEIVEQNRTPTVVQGCRKLIHVSIDAVVSNLGSLPPKTLKRIPLHLLSELARVIQGRFAELHPGSSPKGCIPDAFLDVLPLSVVEEMWTAINERAHLNLDAWKKISKRLLSEKHGTLKELGVRRYRQIIESPVPDLSLYAEPVTSVSFDFLTSLTITAFFPMRDLINLADVVNLGILQFYETKESLLDHKDDKIVPDRLLRAWAGLAAEKGAFPVLRILKFNVLEGGLTDASLRHFNSFPALGLVYPGPHGMSENVSHMAKELGWQALSDPGTCLGPQRSNIINVMDPRNENQSRDPGGQAWHIPLKNFGADNPTSWDRCEVTTLPSKYRHEFLAALETAGPPTYSLSGAKLGGPQYRTLRFNQYYDFVQGESLRKTDWVLFCESLGRRKSYNITDGDVYCLDQFHGFTYLRLDSDLRDAGVKECGAGIVNIGDTFKSIISTAPIVSILLGPRKLGKGSDNSPLTKTWHFLRTTIPDRAPNPDQPASKPANPKSPPLNKRPGGGSERTMRPQKVQKFGDFFGAL